MSKLPSLWVAAAFAFCSAPSFAETFKGVVLCGSMECAIGDSVGFEQKSAVEKKLLEACKVFNECEVEVQGKLDKYGNLSSVSDIKVIKPGKELLLSKPSSPQSTTAGAKVLDIGGIKSVVAKNKGNAKKINAELSKAQISVLVKFETVAEAPWQSLYDEKEFFSFVCDKRLSGPKKGTKTVTGEFAGYATYEGEEYAEIKLKNCALK